MMLIEFPHEEKTPFPVDKIYISFSSFLGFDFAWFEM